MHEFSIVSSLIENCENIAQENNATKIVEVHLQIGRRSGVNPVLLQRAFEEFKIGSLCQEAKIFIQEIEVEITCKDCQRTSEILEINYSQCPLCHSKNVQITKGNEMLLQRLIME